MYRYKTTNLPASKLALQAGPWLEKAKVRITEKNPCNFVF
jgi:hypothetical protein